MSMTTRDLAGLFGMSESDVADVLAGDETAAEAATRLGIAPVVAEELVHHRKAKAKAKKG